MKQFTMNPNGDYAAVLAKINTEQQEKILLSIIAQGRFDDVLRMVNDGYIVTIPVLEALRNSGASETMEAIFEGEFNCRETTELGYYLIAFFGDEQAAKFFRSKIDATPKFVTPKARISHDAWARMLSFVSEQALINVQMWDELLRRHHWSSLIMNGRQDLVIDHLSSMTLNDRICAANALCQAGLQEYCLRHEQPLWLVFMPHNGASRLLTEGMYSLLYKHRGDVKEMSKDALLDAMCKQSNGRDVLFANREYAALIRNGYGSMLAAKGLWKELAEEGDFKHINWKRWYKEESADTSTIYQRDRLDYMLRMAAEAGEYDFLLQAKQHRLLFEKKQYRLWWQSLSIKKNLLSLLRF